MKLMIEPQPLLAVFGEDLELVIQIGDDQLPEIYVKAGLPKPDRHLMLGIIQGAAMAVAEADAELVTFMDPVSLELDTGGGTKKLSAGLVVVRAEDGSLGILATEDRTRARALARQAVRWFTGTIRLDVP
jgi:hypothetical protein